MKSLFRQLSASPACRKIFKFFRLHLLATWYMRTFPVTKTRPSGVRYRAARLESVQLADEMFGNEVYPISQLGRVETMCDLGCNVGFFTLAVVENQPPSPIRALLIDGNTECVADARVNMDLNTGEQYAARPHLAAAQCLHGIACSPGQPPKEFFIGDSNVVSTTHRLPNTRSVKVDCICVEDLWKK